jgi:hypothetical protein
MPPTLTERIARIRELYAALAAVRPDDFAAITLQAEALSHEAGLLAADAAAARSARPNLRLTTSPLRSEDTGDSSR